MELTTLARVKAHLEIASTNQDVFLGQLIASTSQQIELELARHVQSTRRTEIYPLRAGWRTIAVRGSPIDGGIAVKASKTRDFTGSDTLVANTDYILEAEVGVVRFMRDFDHFTQGAIGHPIAPTYMQIVYTGGMAADTDSFIAAYPNLASACDMQIRYVYQRKDTLGGDAVIGEAVARFDAPLNLLPAVQRAIDYYKRRSW